MVRLWTSPIEWADSASHIQESGRNVVAPGQTLTQTKFFIVLRGDPQPRFSNWSMDFAFAAVPPVGGDAGQPAELEVPAGQLPPEIVADRYLLQAERAVRDGNAAAARAAMVRLDALQREHGLDPAAEDHFRHALAWEVAGDPERTMESAVRYLQLRGRDAERYTEALELMNRVEFGTPPTPSPSSGVVRDGGSTQSFHPEPACAGQAEGAECWKELAGEPGCHVWDDHYYADQTVTWTGACSGGVASGTGTLNWVRGSEEHEGTGLLQDGEKTGHWVERQSDGTVLEGPWMDGKRHGRWILRFPDGWVEEGPVVDGKKTGHWIRSQQLRDDDGSIAVEKVEEGPLVDGKRHGHWVLRLRSEVYDAVDQGPFVNGLKHGRWVERTRLPDSNYESAEEGPYVEGLKHGDWVERLRDGTTRTVTYVNGNEQ